MAQPSQTSLVFQISQSLVKAALDGVSDADLVVMLGRMLAEAGLDLAAIEIACDVVDPERDLHWLRWRGNAEAHAIDAEPIFWSMLSEGAAFRRLDSARAEFAPSMQAGASDAVAFASHLAPDATLGFFDDVMSLFITKRPGGFAPAEIDLLHLVTPVFALALGARLNAAAARVLLQTYLGRDAATALLDGRVGLGAVEQIRAIVLYCDLFGFTSLTETLDARSLIENLNLFFETLTRPMTRAGGQISGHVGDAVVMFFPIPHAESESAVCAAAIRAAGEGLEALDRLNAQPARKESPQLRARIGVDIGDVVHGNIGSPGRFSFAIIGTPVNRAARLQGLAKELGTAMLMPAALATAAGISCDAFGQHELRGLELPVDVMGFAA